MDHNFEAEYKNFCTTSKVWQKICAFLEEDVSINSLPKTSKKIVFEAAQATFETVIIFNSFAPNQALEIAKLSLNRQLHDFHSKRSKFLIKTKSIEGVEGLVSLAMIYVVVVLRQAPVASNLLAEMASWDEMHLISKVTAKGRTSHNRPRL